MRRLLAFLGLVLFVVGVLIVPALHSLHHGHCDSHGDSESHDSETCVICTVAATALVAPCTHIATTSIQQFAGVFSLSEFFLPDTLISKSHPARAPPLA